jgi:hypothetical protein
MPTHACCNGNSAECQWHCRRDKMCSRTMECKSTQALNKTSEKQLSSGDIACRYSRFNTMYHKVVVIVSQRCNGVSYRLSRAVGVPWFRGVSCDSSDWNRKRERMWRELQCMSHGAWRNRNSETNLLISVQISTGRQSRHGYLHVERSSTTEGLPIRPCQVPRGFLLQPRLNLGTPFSSMKGTGPRHTSAVISLSLASCRNDGDIEIGF